MLDYYKLLNIGRNATLIEIKKAYRVAALFWHPDKNKSVEAHQKFIDITEAYNILITPHKRNVYDQLYQDEVVSLTIKKEPSYNSTTSNENKKVYEEWIKEERVKAEKLSKISIDNILTESFHFIDQYGWLILFIVMIIFMMVIFANK